MFGCKMSADQSCKTTALAIAIQRIKRHSAAAAFSNAGCRMDIAGCRITLDLLAWLGTIVFRPPVGEVDNKAPVPFCFLNQRPYNICAI